MEAATDETLYSQLRALAASTFPKRCAKCGNTYHSVEDFIRETVRVRGRHSGLVETFDDDDQPIVGLYRNCPCGSTLLTLYKERRDLSEAGLLRRRRFEEAMQTLISRGIEESAARSMLLKFLRGETSPLAG